MNPTIQVTINPDGTCKEVNPLGEKPELHEESEYRYPHGYDIVQFRTDVAVWEGVEATLRTFEIAYVDCTCTPDDAINCQIPCGEIHYPKGAILTAEILPNNKVKILS